MTRQIKFKLDRLNQMIKEEFDKIIDDVNNLDYMYGSYFFIKNGILK